MICLPKISWSHLCVTFSVTFFIFMETSRTSEFPSVAFCSTVHRTGTAAAAQ